MRGLAAVAKPPDRSRAFTQHCAIVRLMGWNARFAAIACAALISGCEAQDTPAPADSATETSALPPLPLAEAPLNREALLLEVVRAASGAAVGQDGRERQRGLAGKLFEVRLRFGCPNDPQEGNGTRTWSFDEERRVVRVEIKPEIVTDTPLVRALAGDDFEAAEGFWIRRPWLLQPACITQEDSSVARGEEAAIQPASSPDAPGAQVGIAQFFTATDARTHRRDRRAYQATKTLAEGEEPSSAGYDLIIRGRLQSLPDGRVIACRPNGAQRPSCLISARFDKVSLERADTKELLADWPSG